MLEVDITLYPRGDRGNPRKLGRGVLINDGSGTLTRGNYRVGFRRQGRGAKIHSGEVKNFPRKTKNCWHLLARALKECGYA